MCEKEIKNKNSFAEKIKDKVNNNVEELKKLELDLLDSFVMN